MIWDTTNTVRKEDRTKKVRETFACTDESLDVVTKVRKRRPSILDSMPVADLVNSVMKLKTVRNASRTKKVRETFTCSDESLDVVTTVRKRRPSILDSMPIADLVNSVMKLKRRTHKSANIPERKIKSFRRYVRGNCSRIADSTTTKCDLRKQVIGGDFMNTTIDCFGEITTSIDTWMFREWQLLMFVSSTFTDTRAERNILLDKILPYLRGVAHPHDIEVTFVDMRWGVRDEHTIDHRTWNECQREIARCRDESSGLFFLSLQSEKYGYRPLPRKILKSSLDEVLDSCKDSDLVTKAKKWYILDENAEPMEYLLRRLDTPGDPCFKEDVLPALRGLLEGIRFDKALSRDIVLGKSVSEWEVKYALKNHADISRALWVRRIFQGNYADWDYCDTDSCLSIQHLINDLYDWMNRKLTPLNRTLVYDNIKYDSLIRKNSKFDKYAERWEKEVRRLLRVELQKIIKSKEQWDADGHGLGLNGLVAMEFLHHARQAHDLCVQFYDRESVLQDALALCMAPNRYTKSMSANESFRTRASKSPSTTSSNEGESGGRFNCISLLISGGPGSGTSAIMAKLADLLYRQDEGSETCGHRPVLIRFCGSSANCLLPNSVIRSLQLQIFFLMGPTRTVFPHPPSDLEKLRDQLTYHPVILLIDGVNVLPGAFDFLENLSPHPDTRIIVSVSGTQPNAIVDTATREKVPLLTLPALSTESIISIMEQALCSNGRRLTKRQWEHVASQVAKEPTALYMNLAIQVVSNWSSDDTPDLKESLAGIVDQILSKIEIECGIEMARRALALITYSAKGINDNGRRYYCINLWC